MPEDNFHIILKGSAYLSNKLIFGPINLQVKSGEWTSLLGPSGVGKTTILNLIAGIKTNFFFKGDIFLKNKNKLDGNVSLMSQEDFLLPWADVFYNVSLGDRLRGHEVDISKINDVIEKVGLLDHIKKFPNQLSGGQKQRVSLARTLIENKPIVLLDEPFSSLDIKTRIEMQELAFKLLENRTVLLITHDPHEASRICNNIFLFEDKILTSIEPLPPPFPKKINDKKFINFQLSLLKKLRA